MKMTKSSIKEVTDIGEIYDFLEGFGEVIKVVIQANEVNLKPTSLTLIL